MERRVRSMVRFGSILSATALAVGCSIPTDISSHTGHETDQEAAVSSAIVYGDVTGDGKVMANDYVMVRDYVLKRIGAFPAANGLAAADVSADGKIMANDYVLIRDFVLKRIPFFPVESYPLRQKAESEGYLVSWNGTLKIATISKNSNHFRFFADGSDPNVYLDAAGLVQVRISHYVDQTSKGYKVFSSKYAGKVNVYQTKSRELVDLELGKIDTRESLPSMTGIKQAGGKKVVMKINGGAFAWSNGKQSEHSGGLFDVDFNIPLTYTNNKFLYTFPKSYYPDFVLFNDNSCEFRNLTLDSYGALATQAQWAIGTFCKLVDNGVVQTSALEPVATSVVARSLVGNKADGTLVFAAVGAATLSNCARFMKEEMNCVNAANLDGSGSSQMVIYDANGTQKEYVAGDRRLIGSAIFVYQY